MVRVGSEISSGTAKAGDRFDATLARPLVVHGKTLARTGAPARGKVTSAKSSGRLHAPGELTLRLTGVQVNGRMVPVATSSYSAKGKGHTKSNATKIGGGAAAGALIGGLVGGGKGGRHRRTRRWWRRNRSGGCDRQGRGGSARGGGFDVYDSMRRLHTWARTPSSGRASNARHGFAFR